MSIIIDIFSWLLIDTVLGFVLYLTGCCILKVITLGRFNMELQDYASFKVKKSKKVVSIAIVGLLFYVLIIAFIASSNS